MNWAIVAKGARFLVLALAVSTFAATARAEKTDAPQSEIAPIKLIDQNGRNVTLQDYLGKPSLVFFGFTNCPSICPTALSEITARMSDLGPLTERLNVIFVTADPERDTAEVLREYLGSFDSRIVGITGGLEEINALAQTVGAKFSKVPLAGGGYTIDHTGYAFLMDRNWHRTGLLVLEPGAQPARAVAKLQELINK